MTKRLLSDIGIEEWTQDATEQVVDDPGLGPDYRLVEGSPAIDSAASTPYTEDIDGHPVPCGDAPDIGASEF